MSCAPIKFNIGFFNEAILNSGLDYAMDFGKSWLLPLQERLKNKYKFLTEKSLNKYDLLCREAMNYGHNFIQQTLLKSHNNLKIKNIGEFVKLEPTLHLFLY